MKKALITHIQSKIKCLKDEISAIEYTRAVDIISDNDINRINELIQKIQVLHEILISFKVQQGK
jgi:hypothetical protein